MKRAAGLNDFLTIFVETPDVGLDFRVEVCVCCTAAALLLLPQTGADVEKCTDDLGSNYICILVT